MKNLFIIILITITLACCKKKSFVPDIPSGSNTIECTIDGKTFQTSGPKGGNNISCNDQVYLKTGGLGGSNINAQKCGQASIVLNFYGSLIEKVYEIKVFNSDGYMHITTNNGKSYYSAQYGGTGNITIIKHGGNYIYGTFEGTINESDGSSITIKNGKFDIAL